jgi:hypothetical protein
MCNGQLYYDMAISLQPAAGLVSYYYFTANGLYDPNISGTGHQPVGFDNLMALYEQYTVLHSRIEITMVGFSDDAARVAVYLNPDSSTLALPQLMENGLLATDVVIASADNAGDGYHRIKRLTLACDVPDYFGRSREAVIADPNLLGTAAANPTEQVYFAIAAWSPFGAGTSVSIDVVISYDSLYWEPRKVTSS